MIVFLLDRMFTEILSCSQTRKVPCDVAPNKMSTCAHIAVLARSERILNVVPDLRGFSQAEVKQEPRINLAKDEAENMLLWGRSLQLPLGVVGRGRSLQLPLGEPLLLGVVRCPAPSGLLAVCSVR